MLENHLISDEKKSFWINASAGTGKTYILVRRVLCLLLRGVSAANILCLTFTKAAAIEMEQRIKAELANWVFLDDILLEKIIYDYLGNIDDTHIVIKRARTLFASSLESDSAIRMMTIHSFAQEIVRKFSFEIGISSEFKIISENELSQLIELAKINTYKSLDFANKNSQTAIENIMKYGNEFLIENMLSEIVKYKNHLKKFTENISAQDLYLNILNYLEIKDSDILELEDLTANLIESIKYNSSCDDVIQNHSLKEAQQCIIFSEWYNQPKSDKISNVTDLIEMFFTLKNEPRKKIIPVKISRNYPDLEEYFFFIQEKISSYLSKVNKIKTIKLSCALYYFAAIFLDELSKLKEADNKLDYDDIIDYAYELLANNDLKEWVLYKIDHQVDHLLVDEAQDTSPIQWEIIKKITEDFFTGESISLKPKSIFIVGDEKQSIYSFQGASHTYLNLIKNFFIAKISMVGELFQVNLDVSYRSSNAVLNLVDKLFNQPEIKQYVSLSADDIIHHCKHLELPGQVEIWPNITEDSDDKSKFEIAAQNIADNIKTILLSGKEIAGKKITAGSFMILIRKRDELYFQIIKKLQQAEISVSGLDRMDVTNHIAILDLIALAKFAIMPFDDLSLATILKSPLFNLTESEIFKICTSRSDSIIEYLKQNKDLSELYSILEEIMNIAYLTPYDFFSHILFKMKKLQAFHARFGNIIEDYINEFLNLVINFEQSNSKNLQLFIRWIDKSNRSIKRQIQPEENMVQILTIHGSKGLQASIVILADACSMPLKKLPTQLILNDQIFLWLSSVYKIDLQHKIKEEEWQQTYAEYLRLLYVAMTRAESSIYIMGVGDAKDESWYSLISKIIDTNIIQQASLPSIINNYDGKQESEISIPNYLLSDITIEPSNFISLKPSEIEQKTIKIVENQKIIDAQKKGILIHKIIEYIPQHNIQPYLDKFLSNVSYNDDFKTSINNAIMNIINHPEYNVAGCNIYEVKIGGTIIMNNIPYKIIGQIDQIIISDNFVHIIDFKTSLNIPRDFESINQTTLTQLAIYYVMVKEIFKTDVVSSLIWTEAGVMMTIKKDNLDIITTKQGINL
jgi:ATP-dependent helicase/nuclease subunit A